MNDTNRIKCDTSTTCYLNVGIELVTSIEKETSVHLRTHHESLSTIVCRIFFGAVAS